MRRTAALLAIAVAVAEIAMFITSELRLRDLADVPFGPGPGPFWTRLPVAVAWMLPWLVGGGLMLRGRRYLATAVLVSVALLALPQIGFTVRLWIDVLRDDQATILGDLVWVDLFGSSLIWVLSVATGVTAWIGRPRRAWRRGAPERVNLYTIAAFLAWLPTILMSTQIVVVDDPATGFGARRFLEFIWTTLEGWSAGVGVATAVLLAGVLLAVPGLRRDAGGLIALVIGVPLLVVQLDAVISVLGEDFLILTPAGVLGAAGSLALVAIGLAWLRDGLRAPELRAARERPM